MNKVRDAYIEKYNATANTKDAATAAATVLEKERNTLIDSNFNTSIKKTGYLYNLYTEMKKFHSTGAKEVLRAKYDAFLNKSTKKALADKFIDVQS